MQTCHSLTLDWQRWALWPQHKHTDQQEVDIVRFCWRVPELYIHSRILVREPWGRGCHFHGCYESCINTRCWNKSFIYTTSILIISSEAVQVSSDITKEELCQYIVQFVERCSTFTLMRDLPYVALFYLRAYILRT